jgi:hypothetical protein
MIDTKKLRQLTDECQEISEAIGILDASPTSVSVHKLGCPVKYQAVGKQFEEGLPHALELNGINDEVRDLIKRRLTEAMQTKAGEIAALCNPPPSMRDVHAVMIQTDPEILAELAELIPPSVTCVAPGDSGDLPAGATYIPSPAPMVRKSPAGSECLCIAASGLEPVRIHISPDGGLAIRHRTAVIDIFVNDIHTLRDWLNQQEIYDPAAGVKS